MRTKIVCCIGLVVALALLAASAFAASSGWKRYTFPAAPPLKVVSPGTMTVQFPAGWRVHHTTWGTTEHPNVTPWADGPPGLWSVEESLLPRGATIDDIRQKLLGRVGHNVWGEGTPIVAYGGESYVTLPMGRVLRLTLKWVPPKGEKTKWKTRQISYERHYVLDRGIVKTIKPSADLEGRFWSPPDGTRRHLFLNFEQFCSDPVCKTHSDELAGIMRSIRITP